MALNKENLKTEILAKLAPLVAADEKGLSKNIENYESLAEGIAEAVIEHIVANAEVSGSSIT